jgi:hypothetical protein
MWYARPQLFFHCSVAPAGSLHDTENVLGRVPMMWCFVVETARPPCPIDLATAKELLPIIIPALEEATEVRQAQPLDVAVWEGPSVSLWQKLSTEQPEQRHTEQLRDA